LISDSYDEENTDTATEDFAFTPPSQLLGKSAGRLPNEGFHYSLPREEDFGSELTIRKMAAVKATTGAIDTEPGIRTTFNLGSGGLQGGDGEEVEVRTVLDQFLTDMGYLGDAIIGKAV
jgi:hypothetical protein